MKLEINPNAIRNITRGNMYSTIEITAPDITKYNMKNNIKSGQPKRLKRTDLFLEKNFFTFYSLSN